MCYLQQPFNVLQIESNLNSLVSDLNYYFVFERVLTTVVLLLRGNSDNLTV